MKIEYNTWPLPNTRQIPASEFWHEVSVYGMPKSTYVLNQSDRAEGGWYKPMVFETNRNKLLGGGFIVKCWFSGPKNGVQEYFTYQDCVHEFEHQSGGNCYHIHTCKKCGARYDVDSSD